MNVEQAEHLARSFGNASRRCEDQHHLPNGQIKMLIVPAIVCAALSIEIGIKSLILKAGGSPWGHNLSELFEQLPGTVKDSIIATVGGDRTQFMPSLAAVAHSFAEWRYIYERSATDINLTFFRALQKAVETSIGCQST